MKINCVVGGRMRLLHNVCDYDNGVIEADSYDSDNAMDPNGVKPQVASLVTMKNAILNAKGRAIRLREGTGYVFDNVQVNVVSSTDYNSGNSNQ